MRAGVWFRSLPRIDRVLVDLTIQVAESIRSTYLAKSVYVVVSKLGGLLEGKFYRLARTTGRALAEKISSIAQSWGNALAQSWANNQSFAYFLAVLSANK